jgi:hypothetical protein
MRCGGGPDGDLCGVERTRTDSVSRCRAEVSAGSCAPDACRSYSGMCHVKHFDRDTGIILEICRIPLLSAEIALERSLDCTLRSCNLHRPGNDIREGANR